MGCTASVTEDEYLRVIPLESQQVNEYIDKLPLFIIQKLKQKFDSYSNQQAELPESQFRIITSPFLKEYESAEIIQSFTHRLYLYYNDLKYEGLKFRNFISKYATLNFCDKAVLSNIIFFTLQKDHQSEETLNKDDFYRFLQNHQSCFGFKPDKVDKATFTKQQFFESLKENGFFWDEYRNRFSLIQKEELPFEMISRGLIDMDISDLEIGTEYYIISSAWFERWSYYYQGVEDERNANIKSTKLLKRTSNAHGKKKSTHGLIRKKASMRDLSVDEAAWIIQKPTQITFDEIEGQFYGELKQNLRPHYECKILSKELWELFKKTMPAEFQFKRTATSASTLDMYPKSIYFLATDSSGQILDKTLQILLIPVKRKLSQIKETKEGDQKRYCYFSKNMGDNIWNEETGDTLLARCSTQSRFFVVKTESKIGFIEKYYRKKKVEENLTYGDKVYSYFSFNKKVNAAYVISLPTAKTAKIHYCDFNFKYQIEVPRESLSVEQDTLEESIKNPINASFKATQNFSFKGLKNIGNTCFINSIIQCLIGTPVMGTYLNQDTFKKDKQPLLYEVSRVTMDLLANKKASPSELKKAIDLHLEIFSGNNQHDAQEFLSFLLDKISSEIDWQKKNPNNSIIEHLFGGVVQSKISCEGCRHEKFIDEKASIVSLPIPEPEYNNYTVYVFPIYGDKIKRIVLRLHRKGTLKDYLQQFEDRAGNEVRNHIFLEVVSGVSKRIRNDFYNYENVKETLFEAGFTPNIEIHSFEKIIQRDFQFIYEENRKAHASKQSKFFDFFSEEDNKWLYTKILSKDQDKVTLEIMDQDSCFSLMKLKSYPEKHLKPLGHQIKQKSFKKLFNRRFNTIFNKMEPFGFHYMISFPKEVTFLQLQKIVKKAMENLIEPGYKNTPYKIKINETNKSKCLFCDTLETKLEIQKQTAEQKSHLKKCCKLTTEQLNTPLIWIAKEKSYSIYIDWADLDGYNTTFASVADVDSMTIAAEKSLHESKIELEQCLRLLQKPENVEIQCDKCKHKQAQRTQILKVVPNILVLHMKEFRFTANHELIKMDANIRWIQFLDISKFCQNPSGSLYELFAYVRHTGTSQCGHYTSVVKRKHPFENKKVWVNFDDDLTNIESTEQKNIESAYLLFFKKVDMPNSAYVNYDGMQQFESSSMTLK